MSVYQITSNSVRNRISKKIGTGMYRIGGIHGVVQLIYARHLHLFLVWGKPNILYGGLTDKMWTSAVSPRFLIRCLEERKVMHELAY